ncbi:Uncharacterised protein [Mycobacterium tuberculosis]|uniref:Uncharacterized protein n=1 Tax=Mycobacterium tuberculosis TaxID=1773 RepID=A0A916L9A6_MYCTX|nr:Uncharacterised protein [Mycobacterium tuberculosis]COX60629.1 Uncharacterised protein [Mycobacterium tuberculosis]
MVIFESGWPSSNIIAIRRGSIASAPRVELRSHDPKRGRVISARSNSRGRKRGSSAYPPRYPGGG